MRSPGFLLLAATLCLARGAPAASEPEVQALARGRLSLAWDAHESGLCDEALRYAREVPAGTSSRGEATWLEADCLSALGRYEEAAALLASAAGRDVSDREQLLADVYWDWAWRHTELEDYEGAVEVLGRGVAALPDEPSLVAFRLASAFRRDLGAAVRRGGGARRLPGGEEVSLRRRGERPRGSGWIQAYPWTGASPWVPEATAEEWMPSLARRLDATGTALWLRVSGGIVSERLEAEARRCGLSLERGRGGLTLGLDGERMPWEPDEWAYRSAAEGLGAKGAAAAAVARARADLLDRARLARWISENRGSLEVRREGTWLHLRDRRTARRHVLDLDAWAGVFGADGEQWQGFWSDLTAELGRPAGPFRCFCGREVVLRETLSAPGPAEDGAVVVAEKGRGYVLTLTALCPLHQQTVTAELLESWGIDLKAAWGRARADALEKAWDLSFARGQAEGVSYLALEGEGVSSLARRPDLLLGALEAVEGREVRGSSVSVLAPTASSLVVLGPKTPGDRARAAGDRALLRGTRRGAVVNRLDYRATLRLPEAAAGVFQVHSAQ